MILSINWLKKFTAIDGSIDELATLIGSRLVEIEEVIDLGKKYQGIVIANVIESSPLEGSDHLNIIKIDDGGVAKEVERDEKGLVQVVCGAPNVRTGLRVAWLPPGSTVPASLKDKEPFVLDSRMLRGVKSNGMLASAKELDLFDDHAGILEIDKDAPAGTDFANAFGLNDYLLDIENKSLTHRPDTFGIVGFAREVAGIQGRQFTTPDSLRLTEPEWMEKNGDIETPSVTIDNPELSGRYQAVVLSNVDAKRQSSVEAQTYLSRIGVRPISAVVDATNYLMMLTGQPLHAFDYDKLKAIGGGKIDIHVRSGREGEKLQLLDGREIELSTNDIVIANGDIAVGLAGAMGGANTEIDENTTTILLESATFNLYNLRNTQMRHGIFSEAITRFTKGQPAALTAPVLAEAIKFLNLSTGAVRSSDVADSYPGKRQSAPVEVNVQMLNDALGSSYTIEEIASSLEHVECIVERADSVVRVEPPYWRTDINIAEDVIEEVGRLNGFDSITPTLPARDFTAVSPLEFDTLRAHIRQSLVRAGANEILTYSFVHGDLLRKAGQNPDNSYQLINSLSPDLQYYRQTLTPSLLQLVHPNSKVGYETFALFELNKGHQKQLGMNEENVPKEIDYLALTFASKKSNGAAYYHVKRTLDYLGVQLGLTFIYVPVEADPGHPESQPFEYRRSAMVSDKATGEYVGIIGEYKTAVKKAFKLPDFAAGFEIDPVALQKATGAAGLHYTPLSRYPSTERDLCFKVANDISYQKLVDIVEDALSGQSVETSITPIDIYSEEGSTLKNVTLRIRLTSHQKTLTGDEVAQVVDVIVAKTKAIGAEIV